MLSQTVEYALRAMVHLADKSPAPQTTEQIVKITKVPQAYLPKVMLGLNRAGLVKSQRGPRGGFALIKDPNELSILDIVNAVDPINRITLCPLNIQSHSSGLCPLHKKLDDTLQLVEESFKTTTLASLMESQTGRRPLCESPSDDEDNIVELSL